MNAWQFGFISPLWTMFALKRLAKGFQSKETRASLRKTAIARASAAGIAIIGLGLARWSWYETSLTLPSTVLPWMMEGRDDSTSLDGGHVIIEIPARTTHEAAVGVGSWVGSEVGAGQGGGVLSSGLLAAFAAAVGEMGSVS